MTCNRHGLPSTTPDGTGHYGEYGWAMCRVCFREARAHADDEALEQKIRDLRYHSTSALMDRLRWDRR